MLWLRCLRYGSVACMAVTRSSSPAGTALLTIHMNGCACAGSSEAGGCWPASEHWLRRWSIILCMFVCYMDRGAQGVPKGGREARAQASPMHVPMHVLAPNACVGRVLIVHLTVVLSTAMMLTSSGDHDNVALHQGYRCITPGIKLSTCCTGGTTPTSSSTLEHGPDLCLSSIIKHQRTQLRMTRT